MLDQGMSVRELLQQKQRIAMEEERRANAAKIEKNASKDAVVILPSELPERFCSFRRGNTVVFVIIRDLNEAENKVCFFYSFY